MESSGTWPFGCVGDGVRDWWSSKRRHVQRNRCTQAGSARSRTVGAISEGVKQRASSGRRARAGCGSIGKCAVRANSGDRVPRHRTGKSACRWREESIAATPYTLTSLAITPFDGSEMTRGMHEAAPLAHGTTEP